jgi:hypothetical protein
VTKRYYPDLGITEKRESTEKFFRKERRMSTKVKDLGLSEQNDEKEQRRW